MLFLPNISRYYRLQVIFWLGTALFYTAKEIGQLPYPYLLCLFLFFAGGGFLVSHRYRLNINRVSFRYDDLGAVAWRILKALSLLALGTVCFDFWTDYQHFHTGFATDQYYLLSLLGYFTDGFIIFSPWFLLFHLYKYGRYISQMEVRHALVQAELRQQQLQNILNKLNPHFLFNTLNTLRWLVNKDKKEAYLAINELSEIMRYTARQENLSLVALQEELMIIEKYLRIEQWRLGEKLQYTLACNPALLTMQVPPFLILNLVENGVKHGVSQQLDSGCLTVTVGKFSGIPFIEISNTGQLEEFRKGFGLTSVEALLKNSYGESACITLREQNGMVVTTLQFNQTPITTSDHAL